MASTKSKCAHPNLKKPPLVRQLRWFLDERGLLRCGGRIHNAPLSKLTKFPYLLPQNSHLTTVYNTHALLSNAGVDSTLAAIQQSFWVPYRRQYGKKLLPRCTTCTRYGGRPYAAPDRGSLPKLRVQDVLPFSITSVDYAKTLYVKEHHEETKVVICLFTCATSRVVTDLYTATFHWLPTICCQEVITSCDDVGQCNNVHFSCR